MDGSWCMLILKGSDDSVYTEFMDFVHRPEFKRAGKHNDLVIEVSSVQETQYIESVSPILNMRAERDTVSETFYFIVIYNSERWATSIYPVILRSVCCYSTNSSHLMVKATINVARRFFHLL
jgi:hypothetical protein